jgi:hypothetical protein
MRYLVARRSNKIIAARFCLLDAWRIGHHSPREFAVTSLTHYPPALP